MASEHKEKNMKPARYVEPEYPLLYDWDEELLDLQRKFWVGREIKERSTVEKLECYDCGKEVNPLEICTDDMQIICGDCLEERYMCPCGCQNDAQRCVYNASKRPETR
jgi:hypothetical protein